MSISITVNGKQHTLDVDSSKPLLWVLREDLGILSPKFGCGISACGACAVLVDGKATRSCVYPLSSVEGKTIRTLEGLDDDLGRSIKDAWIDEAVPQCGYCQPGQITTAYALLTKTEKPTDDDINKQMTNICRCGTYPRIRKAIHRAASKEEAGS